MKKITAVIILLLLIAGCASKSYVKFVDNSIENDIEISSVKERKTNELMEIQIVGENPNDKYMAFKYRVTWEDKKGFEIPSLTSNWTSFPAHKNAKFRINVIAPSKAATVYQIYIDR